MEFCPKQTSISHDFVRFSCSIRFPWIFIGFLLICYGGAKTQKIMKNRCLFEAKLHNCALLQILNVSKYIREALCCVPSLGFELEGKILLETMIFLVFFMLLPSKTMVFLGFAWILPLNILQCLRHGYRGADNKVAVRLGSTEVLIIRS